MAISGDELLRIVNAVLSAIRSNSMTIDQLNPAKLINDNDNFEISAGRRISFALLRSILDKEIAEDLRTQLQTVQGIAQQGVSYGQGALGQISDLKEAFEAHKSAMDALHEGNISEAIENLKEVIAFLEGFKDSDSLAAILKKFSDDVTAKVRVVERQCESVGLSMFDTIVDSVDNVTEDSGDNSFNGSINKHIIFDKKEGRFLLEVHYYVADCPSQSVYGKWPDMDGVGRYSDFYTEDGNVRTDRLYRCNDNLYRYNNGKLIRFLDEEDVQALFNRIANLEKLLKYDADKGTSVLDNAVFGFAVEDKDNVDNN